MADTAVEITAGTGTNIDTRTEATNGNHRQVVVLGDPATNAGVAPVDATAGLKVDLGTDNDITGTVTANLSATDNAVLDAIAADTVTIAGDTTSIDAKIPALGQALAAASTPVVLTAAQITTLTPPAAITGYATSAKQDTIIGHVDGVETLLGTIDADTSALAGAVSGTEMQVDVLTMPTVTVNAHAVTNAGTFAVQVDGAALTSLQLADDVVATLGTTTYTEASTKGTTIGAVRRDADTTLVDTTNEIGPLQMNAAGQLKVEVFSGEALPVTMTSTTVTGTVAVTQSGTWDEVGINDSGNSITVDNAQLSVVGTGTEAAALRVTIASDSTGVLSVDDNGGTLTVDGTVAVTNADITSIKTAVEILDNAISGSEMQVDVVAALPAGTNAIGKLAANSGVDIGDVDVTSLPALAAGTNAIGKLVVQDTDTNGNTNHAQKYYTNAGAVTDGIIWSPAAGKRWHILTLYINVSAAATVTLEDDLAGGDSAVWKGELAANSGVILTYDKDHAFASTEDAADLIITTTAGNVYVQAVGYEV